MSGVNGKTPAHWGGDPQPEKNSGIPVEMPTSCRRPDSLESMIAKYVHAHVQRESKEELETWEDADDFDEQDPDTLEMTKYEFTDMPEPMDPTYDPYYRPEPPQEAPQEEIVTKEGPNPSSQEETPSGASEQL